MKRILSAFIFLFFFSQYFSQLDTEHWFAPMYDGQGNKGAEQYLHLSTNVTTPFVVSVYNNNRVIYQATIRKGSPAKIRITNRDYIIVNEEDIEKIFTVGTMGLFVKGDYPFFANLRFGVTNHAEIITSKGSAGLGTEFYTAMAPNTYTSLNIGFMTSFIATENNTTVTVDGYDKNLIFTDGNKQSSFTVNLNRGESYIIDGRALNPTNRSGFIGAHIVSDKPISVTNGNFNGQHSDNAVLLDGSDILMDQSVPVDKLGNEFILVKGFGKIGNQMERALVVATKPNTSIYVNGASSPIKTLVNPGEYFLVPESHYQHQGNGHYNLHIKTTENAYVYQLMGGVEENAGSTSALATGGMNYIPPLSCYLPTKIDEISDINQIGNTSYLTKLNIITEKGAIVKVNGATPNALYGPYDNATPEKKWVTYSIPNITGNVTIESDKAVTAGLSGGSNAVGYGGYFAGFSKIPLIVRKNGECLPGVVLEITEGFASYEWLIKTGNTYVPAPGVNNKNTYEPQQAGIYAVRIRQGSCAPEQTQDLKFYNCTTLTNYNYDMCDDLTVTPKFVLSTQNLLPPIKIDIEPTQGSATIAADGKSIIYKPNPGATGMDTFEYSFSGDGIIPDRESARATISINRVIANDESINECSTGSTATFDLTKTNYTSIANFKSVTYYKTQLGAETQDTAEQIPTSYAAPTGTIVYARIENTLNCHTIKKVTLNILNAPDVKPENYTKQHCDEEDGKIDNNYQADLNDVTTGINVAGFSVTYFKTQADANTPTAANTIPKNTPYIFTTSTNKIWVRVESGSCPIVIKEVELKIGAVIPDRTGTASYPENVCNDVNLFDYLGKFTTETNLVATYYKSLTDAQNGTNGTTITNPSNVSINNGNNTFYLRISNTTYCARIFKLELNKLSPPAPTFPNSPYTICDDGVATQRLDAGSAYTSWEWYNDNDHTTPIINSRYIDVKPGKYFVIVKSSASPCTTTSSIVEVKGEPAPVIDPTALTTTFCDNNLDGKAEVKFSTDVTPIILQNSALYSAAKYYKNAAMTDLITTDNWSFAVDTPVWVKVTPNYCAPISAMITLKVGHKVQVLKEKVTLAECGDLGGKFTVQNLDNYRNNFTNDAGLNITYHNSKSGAQNGNDVVTNADLTFTNSKTYYLRISGAGLCPSLAELKLNINIPTASLILEDKETCNGTTARLEVEAGFTGKVVWYNENDPTNAVSTDIAYDAPIGNYFVILTAQNGCTHKQFVKVTEVESAKIVAIIVEGSTVTIKAEGGKQPYQYALDNGSFGPNFIFTDVKPGLHTARVMTDSNCKPTEMQFSIIKILNTITPNNDGKNDVVDYSDLQSKIDAKFIVIDRFGKKVYDAADKKDFIWDGKLNGKPLPSDTYWYIMEWKELGAEIPSQQKGWILLKNN
ncbi:gliding motility-associated C-terminal domain-containing protein [Chryseobacterium sp. POL2]|uniref:T9SS type B sorting domain-containing protein n=1 Tax=Chryseobacterium sp. POL2 TaxID=2713414 RepID=UPI0013E20138|nr:T9SS type B sorting domain-containing protein [Chryseobacterium sp. POL2]QIG90496.1 gliding motility-associated C-terminal domain-containing protein [Chryseobacterium sp. POL2]